MIESIAMVLMISGLFFLSIATVGFMRFPDIYCRLHVTGVIDTLGVPLMLLGAAVHVGLELTSVKLLLALVLLYLTSPLVAHLLARSALQAGREPASGTRWIPEPISPESGLSEDAPGSAPDNRSGRSN